MLSLDYLACFVLWCLTQICMDAEIIQMNIAHVKHYEMSIIIDLTEMAFLTTVKYYLTSLLYNLTRHLQF